MSEPVRAAFLGCGHSFLVLTTVVLLPLKAVTMSEAGGVEEGLSI